MAAPFRLLTGIECDINEDGSLDQDPALLARLDVVVASVHSKLRMARDEMTARMVAAISNPHTDVLGHCTGRQVLGHGRGGKGRPESEFDAEVVFAACAQFGVAVEVNSRPERLDPPKRLLRLAVEAGCSVAIDTDAHAPGQLDWQHLGCERAHLCGVRPEQVVNARGVDDLLSWTGRGAAARDELEHRVGEQVGAGVRQRVGDEQRAGGVEAQGRARARSRGRRRRCRSTVRQSAQGRDRPSAPVRRTSAHDPAAAGQHGGLEGGGRAPRRGRTRRRRTGRPARRTAPAPRVVAAAGQRRQRAEQRLDPGACGPRSGSSTDGAG